MMRLIWSNHDIYPNALVANTVYYYSNLSNYILQDNVIVSSEDQLEQQFIQIVSSKQLECMFTPYGWLSNKKAC